MKGYVFDPSRLRKRGDPYKVVSRMLGDGLDAERRQRLMQALDETRRALSDDRAERRPGDAA